MKITKEYLRRVIKEELEKTIEEAMPPPPPPAMKKGLETPEQLATIADETTKKIKQIAKKVTPNIAKELSKDNFETESYIDGITSVFEIISMSLSDAGKAHTYSQKIGSDEKIYFNRAVLQYYPFIKDAMQKSQQSKTLGYFLKYTGIEGLEKSGKLNTMVQLTAGPKS
jgi:hypothetical protein